MKKCSHCGAPLEDDALTCSYCGCETETSKKLKATKNKTNKILKILIKIFLILGCVSGISGFLFPLIWMIPITLVYFKKEERHERISIGFKICALIFVNVIAGVLMLLDNENE